MSRQRGDAASKLLFILVTLAIAATFTLPWLLRSRTSESEANAIATLKRIHAAQTDHYGANRLYTSIAKLRDLTLLPRNFRDGPVKMDEYEFTHTTAGSWQRWCAQAVPDSAEPTGSIYGIDESGIVKEFPAGTSPCYAGELRSPGRPIR